VAWVRSGLDLGLWHLVGVEQLIEFFQFVRCYGETSAIILVWLHQFEKGREKVCVEFWRNKLGSPAFGGRLKLGDISMIVKLRRGDDSLAIALIAWNRREYSVVMLLGS